MSAARVERRLAAILVADVAGHSRIMGEGEARTLAQLAGIAPAMCDVSAGPVADLGHSDASGAGGVIEVTALPLSPPARRIIAEDPALAPRFAGADYELVFASPPDASPAIEWRSELELPITATGVIETRAGVRLVDAARKQLPITASCWQHL